MNVGRASTALVSCQRRLKLVLVGHSMGALVVTKYLERQPDEVLAGVRLAPVPLRGATASTLRFASRHPLVFLKANVG